jgi:DNA (cytosine-5)-methyltransferase 1
LPVEQLPVPELLAARLSFEDEQVLNMWDDFLQSVRSRGAPAPGFPLWSEFFRSRPTIPSDMPVWKRDLVRKNVDFYLKHRAAIDDWRARWPQLRRLGKTRAKFEWQAGDTESVWQCAVQFRPSGVRCKRPTYLPALVAMNQTSYLAPLRRRITVREAARLQGFSDLFDFGAQAPKLSFRQLGNAVPPRLAYWILRKHVLENADDVGRIAPELLEAALVAPLSMPDVLALRADSSIAV